MTSEGTANPKNETIDTSSPYYIHASDSPRQMQTNDPLTDSNYSDWVQEMANFLFAKNKMGFVDHSEAWWKGQHLHAMDAMWCHDKGVDDDIHVEDHQRKCQIR